MSRALRFFGESDQYYEGQHLLCVSAATRDYTEGKVYVVEKVGRALRLPSDSGHPNSSTISRFVPITQTATEDDFAELVG